MVLLLNVNPNTEKPIFIQIAEQLEDSIFTGVFPEETKIPSTNEISVLLNINPHTVLKGMNMLVDDEIIYKKRGLGMFVKEGAVKKPRKATGTILRPVCCGFDQRSVKASNVKRRNYRTDRKGL